MLRLVRPPRTIQAIFTGAIPASIPVAHALRFAKVCPRAGPQQTGYDWPYARSLLSRDLHRVRSPSDMSGAISPCWMNDKIRSIRAARSAASRVLVRCEEVRCRAELANRLAASASADRTATRLCRSILTSDLKKASRSRMHLLALGHGRRDHAYSEVRKIISAWRAVVRFLLPLL